MTEVLLSAPVITSDFSTLVLEKLTGVSPCGLLQGTLHGDWGAGLWDLEGTPQGWCSWKWCGEECGGGGLLRSCRNLILEDTFQGTALGSRTAGFQTQLLRAELRDLWPLPWLLWASFSSPIKWLLRSSQVKNNYDVLNFPIQISPRDTTGCCNLMIIHDMWNHELIMETRVDQVLCVQTCLQGLKFRILSPAHLLSLFLFFLALGIWTSYVTWLKP